MNSELLAEVLTRNESLKTRRKTNEKRSENAWENEVKIEQK